MKSKKASGLSLNMVVIAVLAMVVLVVILAIFGNKMRQSSQEQESAVSNFNEGICNIGGNRCFGESESNSDTIVKIDTCRTGNYIDCPSPNKCCEPVSSE